MGRTSPPSSFLPSAWVCCLEPTQLFSFRAHFLPKDGKTGSRVQLAALAGLAGVPGVGEIHPGHLPTSTGCFLPRPGLSPEGPQSLGLDCLLVLTSISRSWKKGREH